MPSGKRATVCVDQGLHNQDWIKFKSDDAEQNEKSIHKEGLMQPKKKITVQRKPKQ